MNIAEAQAELGLDADADEAAVRARYRELVKSHPPDRDPERFRAIRAAHDLLLDPRARAHDRLFGPAPYADLDDVLRDLRRQPRQPLGVTGWLEVLRG